MHLAHHDSEMERAPAAAASKQLRSDVTACTGSHTVCRCAGLDSMRTGDRRLNLTRWMDWTYPWPAASRPRCVYRPARRVPFSDINAGRSLSIWYRCKTAGPPQQTLDRRTFTLDRKGDWRCDATSRRDVVDGRRRTVGGRPTGRRLDVIVVVIDFRHQTRPPCRRGQSRDVDGAIRQQKTARAWDETRSKIRGSSEETEPLHHDTLPREGLAHSDYYEQHLAYLIAYCLGYFFILLLDFRNF